VWLQLRRAGTAAAWTGHAMRCAAGAATAAAARRSWLGFKARLVMLVGRRGLQQHRRLHYISAHGSSAGCKAAHSAVTATFSPCLQPWCSSLDMQQMLRAKAGTARHSKDSTTRQNMWLPLDARQLVAKQHARHATSCSLDQPRLTCGELWESGVSQADPGVGPALACPSSPPPAAAAFTSRAMLV